jgi:ATP-dependent Clp protease, protease subunit
MAEEEKEEEGLLKGLQEKNLELNLFKARKIFLWSQVDDDSAKAVVTRLLSLEAEDADSEVVLFINSPGGSVSSGMAIYDAMQAVTCPISTVCTGMAASMGAILLAGGAAGRRFAWPHARVMIHQPLVMGTIQGTSTDLDIQAREILRMREEGNRILAYHTGQSVDKIAEDTDRDYFMSPEEARDYGLIDEVISTASPAVNGAAVKK